MKKKIKKLEREEGKFLTRIEKEDCIFNFYLSSNQISEDEFYKNIAEITLMHYKDEQLKENQKKNNVEQKTDKH